MKRFLAVLLSMLLIVGMAPAGAFAEELPDPLPAAAEAAPEADISPEAEELPEAEPSEEEPSAEELPEELPGDPEGELPPAEIPAEEPASEPAEELDELPLPDTEDAAEKADGILTAKNFPDPVLREYLIGEYGTALTAEEAAEESCLELFELPVTDLTGVREFFTGLRELDLLYVNLKTVDLSGMTSLEELRVYDSNTTKLILTGCGSLTRLEYGHCSSGSIVGLPASVTDLALNGSGLTALPDLSGLKLRSLDISSNAVTKLDLSAFPQLVELDCAWNDLAALDLTKCPLLERVYCGHNRITALNAKACPGLTLLHCENNALTELDVSALSELTSLNCRKNGIQTLKLAGCTALEDLDCSENKLTSLDLGGITHVTDLRAGGNKLTGLSLGAMKDLWYLDVSDNRLQTMDDLGVLTREIRSLRIGSNPQWWDSFLDLEDLPYLFELECSGLGLYALYLPRSADLTYLWASDNRIANLDLSGLSGLTEADLSNNGMTWLDVTGCTDLSYLTALGNCLSSVEGTKTAAYGEYYDLGSDEAKGRYQRSGTAREFWKIGDLYCCIPAGSGDRSEYYVRDVNGQYWYPNSAGLIAAEAEPEYLFSWRELTFASGSFYQYLFCEPVTTEWVRFSPDADYLAAERGTPVTLSLYGPDWLTADRVFWTALADPETYESLSDTLTFSVPQFEGPVCDVTVQVLLPGQDYWVPTGLDCRVDATAGTGTVSIFNTKVTADLAKETCTKVRILPEFPELAKGTGNAVTSVRFENEALDEWFTVNILDDRTLELVPREEKLYALRNGTLELPKAALKSRLIVYCLGRRCETKETLQVTLKAKLPSLKAGTVSLNSYVRGQSAPVKITGAEIAEITGTMMPAWLELDQETMLLTYTGEKGMERSDSAVITCRAKGCSVLQEVTVKVTVKPVAPVLKLSASTVTMYSGMNDFASVTVSLNDPYKDRAGQVYWDVRNIYGVTSDYDDGSEDNVRIFCAASDPEKGTVTYGLVTDGRDPSVSGTVRYTFTLYGVSKFLTVKLKPATKPKLSLKTAGSINLRVPGSCVSVIPAITGAHPMKGTFPDEYGNLYDYGGLLYDFTVDRIEESGTGLDVKDRFVITDYEIETRGTKLTDPGMVGPWIQFRLKDGHTLAPGRKYTAYIKACTRDLSGCDDPLPPVKTFTKAVKLSIVSKAAKATVRIKTEGTLSASDQYTNNILLMYPTFMNAPFASASDLTFDVMRVYDASRKKKLSEDWSDQFDRLSGWDEYNVVPIRFRAWNYALDPGDKFTFRFYYQGKQITSVTLTVGCAALKPQYSEGILYRNDSYSRVDLGRFEGWDADTMLNRLIGPGLLTIDKTSAKWFELSYDPLTRLPVIRWKDGIVPADARKGKITLKRTVTLILNWPGIGKKTAKLTITVK